MAQEPEPVRTRRRRWAWTLLAGWAVGGVGCTPALPSASVVDKLRVLAVRAEPPDVRPGEETVLDALVVPADHNPDAGAAPVLSYLWLACLETPGQTLPTACGVSGGADGGPDALGAGGDTAPRCDANSDVPLCVVGSDPVVRYRPPASVVAAASGFGQVIVTLIVADDSAGGALGCARAASLGSGAPPDPDHCVIALKRLTVGLAQDGAGKPRAVNHNPRLIALTLDGRSLLDASPARFVATPAGTAAGKEPTGVLGADRCGDAVSAGCPSGAAPEVKDDGNVEALGVSWFTTAGSLSASRASFQKADCTGDCLRQPLEPTVTTTWTPPVATAAPRTVRLWAVVRDGADRGGVGWLVGAAVGQ